MTIGVVNELRGKGISNLMIDHLKELTIFNKQISNIYLHMVTYNQIGSKFYQKNGFKIVDKLE